MKWVILFRIYTIVYVIIGALLVNKIVNFIIVSIIRHFVAAFEFLFRLEVYVYVCILYINNIAIYLFLENFVTRKCHYLYLLILFKLIIFLKQ